MKIALVVPGFSADERDWCIPALLDYVRALAGRAEVHVFALRYPAERRQYAVYGARVHAFGGAQHLGARAPALWAAVLGAIRREHARRPFDGLHAVWADEPGLLATLAGALLRRPVIVSLAGGELCGLRDIGYGLQLLPGRGPLIRWVLRRASVVTAGSEYLRSLARDHLRPPQWSRLVYLPLGVDGQRFVLPPGRRAAASRTVINVGSLYPVKNQTLLLRAMARVPDACLQIVGQGPMLRQLRMEAESLGLTGRVTFVGAVDHGELAGLYQSADVLAQVSRHEAQGMAVLEAAACGVPVLGTPVGVLPEVGRVAGDEASLAGALQAQLEAGPPDALEREALRDRVLRNFALPVAVQRFVGLYEQLAA